MLRQAATGGPARLPSATKTGAQTLYAPRVAVRMHATRAMRKVFISHRNGEPEVMALIQRLTDEMRAAGLEVLVDFERLKPGAVLRQDIYTWLGVCHAAIVVLSPDALSENSVWVPTESSILAWRRTLDPSFVLIPVLLPGVGIDDLRVHLRYRDLGLHDLLCVQHADDETSVHEILKGIAGLVQEARSPLDDLADAVMVLLGDVSEDFLHETIRLCGTDPKRLPPGLPLLRQTALALLQAPLDETAAALEYLAPRMATEVNVDRILELVAPGWVDLSAARWIAYCAAQPAPRPAAVLNARLGLTAEMYVRRACSRPPKTMWHLVKVTAVHGEAVFEDLAVEIQEALKSEFAPVLLPDPMAGTPEQQLDRLLAALQRRGRPVVMALRLPDGHLELLPSLQERFPTLTFLFLSGDELPPDNCPVTLLRRVEPELEEGREAAAITDYQTALSTLRSVNSRGSRR